MVRNIGTVERVVRLTAGSAVTGKIVTTLRRWCRAVENDLGPLLVEAMPRQSREVLARLAPETAEIGA